MDPHGISRSWISSHRTSFGDMLQRLRRRIRMSAEAAFACVYIRLREFCPLRYIFVSDLVKVRLLVNLANIKPGRCIATSQSRVHNCIIIPLGGRAASRTACNASAQTCEDASMRRNAIACLHRPALSRHTEARTGICNLCERPKWAVHGSLRHIANRALWASR